MILTRNVPMSPREKASMDERMPKIAASGYGKTGAKKVTVRRSLPLSEMNVQPQPFMSQSPSTAFVPTIPLEVRVLRCALSGNQSAKDHVSVMELSPKEQEFQIVKQWFQQRSKYVLQCSIHYL
jgi:hypothetical protein